MTDRHQTNHYGEDTLELFLLAPGSLDPRLRREIGDHLADCAVCSALRSDLTAMHGKIDAVASGEPTGEDRRAADRLARRGRDLVPVGGIRTFRGDALDGYAESSNPPGWRSSGGSSGTPGHTPCGPPRPCRSPPPSRSSAR